MTRPGRDTPPRLRCCVEALAEAEARATVREAARLAEARRPWLARVLEGLRRKGS